MISYWIVIIADETATLLLFSPTIASLVLRPEPFEVSDAYIYVSRVVGGLMLGWTILLFWGQLQPIDRADILFITLFPVATILSIPAVLLIRTDQVSFQNMLPIFLLYVIIYLIYIPSWVWAKKQQKFYGNT
jgi:hypothetical protein